MTLSVSASEAVVTTTEWPKDTNFIRITSSTDGKKLAAIKIYGYIYTSSDSWATWTARTTSGERNWQAITMSANGTVITAANKNGYIYTSSDSWATWAARTTSGERNWQAITMSANGVNQYAVYTPYGYIYASTNSWATWAARTGSGQKDWQTIATSSNGKNVVAAVKNWFVYKTTNYGWTWTEDMTFSVPKNWHTIFSSDDGMKLIITEAAGSIFHSVDGGARWYEKLSPGNKGWNVIAASNNITKLALGVTNQYLFTSADYGGLWEENIFSGKKIWSLLEFSGNWRNLYASDGETGYTFSTPEVIITNISSNMANGTYKEWDKIPIEVSFSEPVTSRGNVIMKLETGEIDRTCSFTVFQKEKIICEYLVRQGDNSEDLTVLSLTGIITDIEGNVLTNFIPLKNLLDNKNIVIKTNPPLNSSTDSTCQKPWQLYSICPTARTASNVVGYENDLVCEGIITQAQTKRSYKRITRGDVLGIAVNMLRVPMTDSTYYSGDFEDITEPMKPMIQTALDHGLITNTRLFEPQRLVTRLEAYTLLMKGVCLNPVPVEGQNWIQAVYQTAYKAGITNKNLSRFKPSGTVTKKEVFIIASQLADWADITGGCQPQVCK